MCLTAASMLKGLTKSYLRGRVAASGSQLGYQGPLMCHAAPGELDVLAKQSHMLVESYGCKCPFMPLEIDEARADVQMEAFRSQSTNA